MNLEYREFNLEQLGIDPTKGIPEDLFLKISSLTPIPNVDLFILNEHRQLLLSWRDDPYFGRGWHLPGGCIRFKEKMIDRVHETAKKELGFDVEVDEVPIAVRDVIIDYVREGLENPNTRAHHIAVLYRCRINQNVESVHDGTTDVYQWFSKIPDDILQVHDVYRDIFKEYGLL